MKVFPDRLLPKKNYKKIPVKTLLNEGVLLRHTEGKDIINPEDGLVKAEKIASPTKRMTDLSTNLIGVFLPEDRYIKIEREAKNGYFLRLWEEGTEVITPQFPEDFIIDENRGYFLLKIKDLHNKALEFEYNGEKLKGICKIIHTPMNWNFWHFSIHWLLEGKGDLDALPKINKRQKFFLHSSRRLLAKIAFWEIETLKPIEEKLYKIH